jgi:hypothetical protein
MLLLKSIRLSDDEDSDKIEPMTCFYYKWEHGEADFNKPILEETLTLVTFTLEDADAGARLRLRCHM